MKSLIKKQSKISGTFGGQDYFFFPGSHVHSYLRHYEEKYGTVVNHREWWKEQNNHYKLASSTIPSKDLINKDSEANYWRDEITDLNKQCFKKMPTWVRFFRKVQGRSFEKTFGK